MDKGSDLAKNAFLMETSRSGKSRLIFAGAIFLIICANLLSSDAIQFDRAIFSEA